MSESTPMAEAYVYDDEPMEDLENEAETGDRVMSEYKHVECGYSFNFTWPGGWDDDLKVAFLREASRCGNRVTLPMNEGHLIEAAAKKAADHAQR